LYKIREEKPGIIEAESEFEKDSEEEHTDGREPEEKEPDEIDLDKKGE